CATGGYDSDGTDYW
nr:immunoglobulin heavy chain junction region [Mus musculus]